MAIFPQQNSTDILSQLGQLLGMGSSDSAQTFAAPTNTWSPTATSAAQPGLGFNMPTGQLALQGLGSLGSLWGAYQANSLAKDQFNFTKQVANTNLNNSIQSYNTALEDRLRARGITEGTSSADVAAQIERNRLTR